LSFLVLAPHPHPHPHPLNETSFSIENERAKIEFHGGIRLKQKVTRYKGNEETQFFMSYSSKCEKEVQVFIKISISHGLLIYQLIT
jgi:hypothetical protein